MIDNISLLLHSFIDFLVTVHHSALNGFVQRMHIPITILYLYFFPIIPEHHPAVPFLWYIFLILFFWNCKACAPATGPVPSVNRKLVFPLLLVFEGGMFILNSVYFSPLLLPLSLGAGEQEFGY